MLDFRRYVRPFFLTPDGTQPTQYKIYYDIFGTVVIQAALAYMAAPFIVLGFKDSLTVWSRVWVSAHKALLESKRVYTYLLFSSITTLGSFVSLVFSRVQVRPGLQTN